MHHLSPCLYCYKKVYLYTGQGMSNLGKVLRVASN